MVFSQKGQGARREGRYSSEVPRGRGALRVRCDVEDPFNQERAASRNLLELSSVLHGTSEADRYRRARGALHEEVRGADVGEPERSGQDRQDDEENAGGRSLIFRSILASRCWTDRVHAGWASTPRLNSANVFAASRSRTRCSWWIASASVASRASAAGQPRMSTICCHQRAASS